MNDDFFDDQPNSEEDNEYYKRIAKYDPPELKEILLEFAIGYIRYQDDFGDMDETFLSIEQRKAATRMRDSLFEAGKEIDKRFLSRYEIQGKKWQKIMIEKDPKLAKVFAIFDHIKRYAKTRKECMWISQERGIDSYIYVPIKGKYGKGTECPYALFIPEYALMERALNLSKRQIQKYLKVLCDEYPELIKKAGRDGEHGNMIYIVGRWRPYPGTIEDPDGSIAREIKADRNLRRDLRGKKFAKLPDNFKPMEQKWKRGWFLTEGTGKRLKGFKLG